MINRDNMAAPAKSIGFEMYGVKLNLMGDYIELLEYQEMLMPGLSGPPHENPDLEVYAHWLDTPHQKGVSYFENIDHLNGIGKRMLIGEDELVWVDTHRDKDMQLAFRRNGQRPVFDVAYCYQPSQKKQVKYPKFREKKFFDLARYLVFFPIAWHLERTRSWMLIHASAVSDGENAILIAGPGGAGKTTTCVGLIARTGMKLLTENLLLCDGEKIYPVIEPLRLTDDSLALLKNAMKGLEPIELPGGLRTKTMYWLPEGQKLRSAKPAIMFIPQFAKKGFTHPLSPGLAQEQINATNRLTLELNDYYWYTAALDVLWPEPGNSQRQLNVLNKLTKTAPCYSLGIDKSAGVEPVVDQILHCLELHNTFEEVH